MRGWLTRSFATGSAVLALTLAGTAARAADLGSPPSGEIPILFNDHTVYAKPDILTDSRVLAALVKDGQLYVPLRSMFEAMGATVTASPDGKTVTATKSGASVSVTLGKAEVLVNGETRPLDVPPMLVNGIVRVLSEAMGAYVQWVPSRHVVVVRYIAPPVEIPPTPTPTLAPTPTPLPSMMPAVVPPLPTAAPTAAPTQAAYGFIQAAVAWPRNYNELSAGQYCPE